MTHDRSRLAGPARLLLAAPLLALLSSAPGPRAEILEEIVARVNDDAITRSELLEAEQQTAAELMERKSGEELQKELASARSDLLKDMITKKLLVQQAEHLYDLTKMQEAFVRQFKEQQKIGSNSELERVLKEQGMTLDEFRKRLIEFNAPGSVIQYEVRDKIAVSEGEVEAWYEAHGAELTSPEKVSIREIVLLEQGRSREETLAAARELARRAREGEDFTSLAKERSEVDPAVRGSLLGPFTRGELAPELEQAVFALKLGEVSEPVEVGPTVHVAMVERREESLKPSLDSMREKVYDTIEREKYAKSLDEYLLALWSRAEIHVADAYVERLPVDFRRYLR